MQYPINRLYFEDISSRKTGGKLVRCKFNHGNVMFDAVVIIYLCRRPRGLGHLIKLGPTLIFSFGSRTFNYAIKFIVLGSITYFSINTIKFSIDSNTLLKVLPPILLPLLQ